VNSFNESSFFFDLSNNTAYDSWRARKLDGYPLEVQSLVVNISDFQNPTNSEVEAMRENITKTNMTFYKCKTDMGFDVRRAKDALNSLGLHMGFKTRDPNLCADEDSYSILSVTEDDQKNRYIPYTNKPINWHTDGYYNPGYKKVLGMGLHCISPAAVGGENALLDPEIIYIFLRDENPDFVQALMHPRAMEIPANVVAENDIRPVQTGPVFSLFGDDATLHMRYTARTRSIKWRQDEVTKAALRFLRNILKKGCPYIFRRRLEPGEGILCNNVLHNRTGFEDDNVQQRCFLRTRYFDRITK